MRFSPAGTGDGLNSRHKQIVIVGLNHRSAPIEVRESVAFEHVYVREALVHLHDYPSIAEGVIVSTCNRVEVIAAAGDARSAFDDINGFLAQQKAQRHAEPLDDHVYIYEGPEAVR